MRLLRTSLDGRRLANRFIVLMTLSARGREHHTETILLLKLKAYPVIADLQCQGIMLCTIDTVCF
jgi:hypothetical protein